MRDEACHFLLSTNKAYLRTKNASIGRIKRKPILDRELWVLRVTADIENVPIMRPRVKWVANMHGDESVGRELTIQMAQYLTQSYLTNSTISTFLQEIDLHLMPSLNPDGFEKSTEGKCETSWRNNANRVDLNRNFPDQYRDKKWDSERKGHLVFKLL